MSKASDPIEPGENLISTSDVLARVGYLAFLEEDDPDDPVDTDLWADEIEELKKLRDLIDHIGETEAENGVTLVSEDYWPTYAQDEADELFNLRETGAGSYFKYDAFASAYQQDFASVEFGDVTYWHNYH